jgi:serine-type D-Ala-D-Ala carboxypeptidase (penicillin-binding protein 5/6)
MRIRRIFSIIVFFLIFSFLLFPPNPAEARKRFRGVSAKGAIFSNSTQGKRYYGKDPEGKILPASTVKVMTALLVLEHLSLEDEVTVSSRAPNVQPTKIDLRAGEKFKVRDLLYALLLGSANDASIALAEAVSGSEENFVNLMNQRARQLGASNTHFTNSNGLPTQEEQYTTAYDMYLIFRQALKYDFFKWANQCSYKTIYSAAGRKVMLRNHNKILFSKWKTKIYGKTGYTRGARYCFVGYLMKGEDICIIAVFGCSHRWTDIKYIVSRYGGISL